MKNSKKFNTKRFPNISIIEQANEMNIPEGEAQMASNKKNCLMLSS